MEALRANLDEVRARCSTFAGFFKEAWPIVEPHTRLRWNWHLDAICLHCEAISREQINPRLLCNVPPGSSKSTAISVLWQAWEWGPLGRPGLKFLSTSYEQSNVNRDTRKTRDLILSEWYRMLWPDVQLVRRGEASFSNTHTGSREGVPFSSLTAKRGDRLTIDDPHSLDGAESEAEREKAVRRFIEGGQNRLNDQERSAIVIVMQRLHERDLTGEILARELGYVHLMIPMEFEPERRCVTSIGWHDPRSYDGELMDPQRFPQSAVDLLKKDNDYMFAGQYQQRPAPREGGMFKVDNIQIVESVPPGVTFRTRGWDIAGSTKKRSPFTAGVRMAYKAPMIYIEDCARARAEVAQAEELMIRTSFDDGTTVLGSFPQDPGQAGKAQKVHLGAKLQGLNFIFTPESGTKEDRAIPLASQVNNGNVALVKGPWNSAFIDEMRNFPASAYKDQIDAASRAYAEIAKRMNSQVSRIAAPEILKVGG